MWYMGVHLPQNGSHGPMGQWPLAGGKDEDEGGLRLLLGALEGGTVGKAAGGLVAAHRILGAREKKRPENVEAILTNTNGCG